MHRNPQPGTLRQIAAPFGHRGGFLNHRFKPCGLNRIFLSRAAVIAVIRAFSARINNPIFANQLKQIILLIPARGRRHFSGKALHRKSVEDIAHRAQPTGAHVALGFARFNAQIGRVKGHIGCPQSQLTRAWGGDPISKGGRDRWEGRAVQIAGAFARFIQPRFHTLSADRVIKTVTHIVFARPGDLHRLAHFARDQRGLDHKVRLGLATKGAAQPCGFDGDIFLVHA